MTSDGRIEPRFVTDQQLLERFGLGQTALRRLRATRVFPQKDRLIGKTDSRAVDLFFDRRAGLASPTVAGGYAAIDGKENFVD